MDPKTTSMQPAFEATSEPGAARNRTGQEGSRQGERRAQDVYTYVCMQIVVLSHQSHKFKHIECAILGGLQFAGKTASPMAALPSHSVCDPSQAHLGHMHAYAQ